MMNKKIYGFLLLVLFVGFMTSCAKDYEVGSDKLLLMSPYDKQWQFVGFGPASTNTSDIFSATPVQPDSPTSYLLTLKKNNTFNGTSSTNDIHGEYSIDDRRSILSFKNIVIGKLAERGDGYKYISYLKLVENYEVYEGNLKLYYASPFKQKSYLLYRAVR